MYEWNEKQKQKEFKWRVELIETIPIDMNKTENYHDFGLKF